MKKNDIILGVLLVVIAIICGVLIQVFVKKQGDVAEVRINGQVYKSMPLNVDSEFQIDAGEGVDGYNILVIKNGVAFMKDADCPDKNCVHQGKISKVGETIVCMPHKVVIEIKGNLTKYDSVVQ